jgi:hypothetical protein
MDFSIGKRRFTTDAARYEIGGDKVAYQNATGQERVQRPGPSTNTQQGHYIMNGSLIVIDGGNSLIKAKRGSDGREVVFAHALAQLTEADYQHVLKRTNGKAPEGYVRVNGKPYAYGPTAEHYTIIRRTRANKYTPDYYGVFVAICLARLFDKSSDVSLFGSHPPGDVDYRDNLMSAGWGNWHVEIDGTERAFKVDYANTFDEPAGGLFNVVLAADGRHYQHSEINNGRALVIDIGGRTTDWIAVNPGGAVDYSLHESTQLGLLDVMRDFEKSFRANNSELLRSQSDLPAERVRAAIRTGIYTAKGHEFPCENEVTEATSKFMNKFMDVYNGLAGGGADFDSIILSGGGPGTLYERLLPILDHAQVILADVRDQIHLATVRGGLKLWRLLEAEGLLD